MSEVSTQTLHVVARELNAELNDARVALELFAEQQEQVELLTKCRDHLRQVRGALRLVEVFGAALLVEEMEQLSQYLIDHIAEQRHLTEGMDALMRAMVQLPTYLERVMGGGRDMALILLPLLNDLRAVRGHALLSEGTLLLLNLSSDQQANPVAASSGEPALPITNWARRMRTRFQLGLLGWIKGERVEQNLEILARAAEKLEQTATTQAVFQLWWVVGAVVEALRDGGLEGTASVKRLLGQADRQMKRLYEIGEQAYSAAPSLDLLNNLLYYVARASSDGLRVTAVRASFRLHELLPLDAQVQQARDSLSAPSVKLMHTVAAAIKEDLAQVKDALDIYVRKPDSQPTELSAQLDLLKKIGDTLGVLGLGELRETVQQQTASLQALLHTQAGPDEASLLAMAAVLINVENNLDEQLLGLIAPAQTDAEATEDAPAQERDVEFRQVAEAVLRECIVNLARIKEAIGLAMEKPGELQALEQIPNLMRGIVAGLLMLGKSRAVEVTERIGAALNKYARGSSLAQMPERLDRLADAMVSMEYYMETLQAGRGDPWYMLDNAETCLRALDGMATGSTARVPSLDGSAIVSTPVEHTLVIDPQRTHAIHQDGERTMVLNEFAATPAATAVSAPEAHTTTAVSLPPVLARPIDKQDPEFLELFIEEARDEIIKLQQMLPRWDDNPQDQDALVNLRRSLHTLKGSGRLVGAQLIGEFAWSMENLLNRLISKTLDRTPQMLAMLKEAVAILPSLVEQLESGLAPQGNVGALIAQAQALAAPRTAPSSKSQTGTQPALPAVAEDHPPSDTVVTATVVAAAAPTMDITLNDIFAKEVAGHLAQVRQYIDKQRRVAAPHPVTEALHRACHTLNGASKTADARHSIRITEPLNHYIRKLYDNDMPLPQEGLVVLQEAMNAIEHIVSNLHEDTQFFSAQGALVMRLSQLEQRLDAELAERNAPQSDHTGVQTALAPRLGQPEHAEVLENSFSMSLSMSLPLHGSSTLSVEDIGQLADPRAVARDVLAGKTKASRADEQLDEDWVEITTDDLRRMMVEGDAPTLLSPAFRAAEVEDSQAINLEDIGSLTATPLPEAEPDTIIETAPWAANFAAPVLDEALAVSEPIALPARDLQAEELGTEQITQEVPHLAEPHMLLAAALQEVAALAPESATASTESAAEAAASMADESFSTESVAPIEWTAIEGTMEVSALPALQELNPASAPAVAPTAVSTAAPAVVTAATVPPTPASSEPELDADFDPDIAAIFTEEATELLEAAELALHGWQADSHDSQHVHSLKRSLHTLKGGARMAGIRAMGDLAHELESFMERVELGAVHGSATIFTLLQSCLDELNRMRDYVAQGRGILPADALIARIQAAGRGDDDSHLPVTTAPPPANIDPPPQGIPANDESIRIEFDSSALQRVLPSGTDVAAEFSVDELEPSAGVVAGMHLDVPAREATLDFELSDTHSAPELVLPTAEATNDAVLADEPAPQWVQDADTEAHVDVEPTPGEVAADAPAVLPPGRATASPERGEVARVDAELLDNLLNNAGEVSILRSRLEQQVSSLEFNLSELSRTTTRLKDQFRQLEIETEAQILHKHQEDQQSRSDFDPLELDRYSSIQQLSRALGESVSDVDSIEGLLETMTREAQNLLLQQARVVTEMQNGLMRTRMVPFSRHAQRLTRLVRQVAADVGKQVELKISGASGELDRQVLERMLPPFEHMLRNSVVHGIESPDQRRVVGKPETGSIAVDLRREGAEMVIVLQDDGRGIDVNAVREKARLKGLISADQVLTDEQALQLILEPGFSTASTVTQHAGRGVGMDVVVNEIKKLGGALFTESKFGAGVKFTIRLPFTLAISQSLLVRVGDSELYALPLPTVEGVVRLPRAEVQAYLADAHSSFHYGDQSYKVQHLGAFIDGPTSQLADGEVALVLIKAGEHSTALVTDELLGNREIVVKTVGPQIASIRGIAGATILGDGRVVIILDMGALVRSEWRTRLDEHVARGEDRRTLVMVVDDSITVRRVTQRLLERHGMRVLTAKDGQDALETLQEHTPDIMLLDIEMPRMDGYELASRIRSDQRLATLPIIMITSRVSDKHRARAIEIGVDDYLGKPYQENQLLDAIEALLRSRRLRGVSS